MAEPNRLKTILVVEDNPLNMKLAVDLLTLNGFAVLTAADGEAAVELLKTQRPDLILLDLHLPGMDGFELFKRIRADARLAQVKIVALTASAMREEAQQVMTVGFDNHIAKPIDTKPFIATIRAMVS